MSQQIVYLLRVIYSNLFLIFASGERLFWLLQKCTVWYKREWFSKINDNSVSHIVRARLKVLELIHTGCPGLLVLYDRRSYKNLHAYLLIIFEQTKLPLLKCALFLQASAGDYSAALNACKWINRVPILTWYSKWRIKRVQSIQPSIHPSSSSGSKVKAPTVAQMRHLVDKIWHWRACFIELR